MHGSWSTDQQVVQGTIIVLELGSARLLLDARRHSHGLVRQRARVGGRRAGLAAKSSLSWVKVVLRQSGRVTETCASPWPDSNR